MSQKEDVIESIEQEIINVFKRLVEEKPNVSFIYSYVFSTTKDPITAKAKGRVNMAGSKEEVEIHINQIQELLQKQIDKENKRKKKVYDK